MLSVATACGSCGDTNSHNRTSEDDDRGQMKFTTFPTGGEDLISNSLGFNLEEPIDIDTILLILNDKELYIYPSEQTPNHLICSRTFEKGKIQKVISASVPKIYGPQSQKVSFGFDSKGILVCADILKPKSALDPKSGPFPGSVHRSDRSAHRTRGLVGIMILKFCNNPAYCKRDLATAG